ncbi:esterase B1-like [Toxorhynchites rutilus septentrionalis]|uniref:esterase B1-like n=1 Tax=Toxorhynchites rutilus septentrionalis TaxID=329112 RepID=UPI002478B3A1|nr:esterase B1-like [Toxorhynchites rutilus septentrionalis]
MSIRSFIIDTKYGPVRGTTKQSLLGQQYISFQGIPYARPPIGKLRFKAPIAPEKWTEDLDCSQQCLPCYQFDRRANEIVGSEDSLRINVFTKTINTSNLLPVMVFIYGGSFTEGTSGTELFGPDFLLQKDIVLVSFNYRVGALGFLSCQSPDDEVPGNAGLKDQHMAIKWVVENIAAFGGDPQKITLCGHSAGACSVQYHIISDASKNLFQRAIIMSGSSYSDWALSPQRNWTEKLAKAIGWDGEGNESVALKFLQTAKPEDIVSHQEKLLEPQDRLEGLSIAFGPTIEPYYNDSCIIPKCPLEMARDAWGNNIDVMIGGTSEEGLIILQKVKLQPEIIQNPKLFLDSVPVNLKISTEQREEFANKLKQRYYPDSEPSYENNAGYVNMMSDKIFWHGMNRTILARANEKSSARTYVYRFAVDSDFFNHYRIKFIDPKLRGTSHCDELSYLFSNFTEEVPGEDTFEYRAMQTLVDVFTSFVFKGDPNCEHTAGVSWEPVTQTKPTFKCLNITNDGVAMVDFPDAGRMDLWDSFYVNDSLY